MDANLPRLRDVAAVSALMAVLALAPGCSELRGRRNVREGNQLYREGHYAAAVAAYERAERFIPGFWLLWLNKGLTCRQMMVPGAHTADNERALGCALAAFANFKRLRPNDQRAEALYVQTLFDGDRYPELVALYEARLRADPADLAAINGLIQVYGRWNRLEEALRWHERRAALQPRDADAQYAVGVFLWNQLFQRGGGPEMAAFDPRAPRAKAAAAPPPAPAAGDITGAQRVRLADLGVAYLEKALALRPGHREAMTYLNLLYRQKSLAYLADPPQWQAAIDAAERWRRQAESLAPNP